MYDRKAEGKIVSPIITSSTDLVNLSHVTMLTKYPLAPARNAELIQTVMVGNDRNTRVCTPASQKFDLFERNVEIIASVNNEKEQGVGCGSARPQIIGT
jgi:hypothetical protein